MPATPASLTLAVKFEDILVSSYSWGVTQTGIVSPRDAASGQATGRR